MTDLKTTITRENEISIVRYWDVYRQQWAEAPAGMVSDRILATLTDAERRAIADAKEAV